MEHTQVQEKQLIVGTSICLVLSSVAVLARLISRRLQKAELIASDWTIVVGLLGAWATDIAILIRMADTAYTALMKS